MKNMINSLSIRTKLLLSFSIILGMTLIMHIYNLVTSGKSLSVIDVFISVVFILVGVGVALISAHSIIQPIQRVTERMNVIGEGDLTQEPLEVESTDEIGILAMNISTTSESVASHSEELTQSSNEIYVGAEQVSATMQELAGGVEQQASTASDLASVSAMFVETTEEMNQYGKDIETSSQEVLIMTSKGQELMNASNCCICFLKINGRMKRANNFINSLPEKYKTIIPMQISKNKSINFTPPYLSVVMFLVYYHRLYLCEYPNHLLISVYFLLVSYQIH